MRILFLSFLLFITGLTYAQDTCTFIVSNRVNMKEDPVRLEVLQLYKDYFNSRPDTLHDNPYWNKKEKEKHLPNLSLQHIFNGVDMNYLMKYFSFYVLSIEKLSDISYSIRTLIIFNEVVKGGASSVWCIHKVTAIKEDNEWYLQNNLVQETSNWNKYYISGINYYVKDSINHALVSEAANFVDSIRTTFGTTSSDTLDYYVAQNVDELGLLLGFDYFYAGFTTGVTGYGFLMSTRGEFYAHELVHFALTSKNRRNFMIEEGIAEFLGTKKQNKERYYNWFNKLFKDILSKNYTIDSLLNQSVRYNGYNYKYPFGALLCELVYEKKGIRGLKKLIFSDTRETDSLRVVLSNILSIKPKKLDKFIFDFVESKEQLYKSFWEKYKNTNN